MLRLGCSFGQGCTGLVQGACVLWGNLAKNQVFGRVTEDFRETDPERKSGTPVGDGKAQAPKGDVEWQTRNLAPAT